MGQPHWTRCPNFLDSRVARRWWSWTGGESSTGAVSGRWMSMMSKNWELSEWSSFSPKHAILGTQVLGKATQKTLEDILKWSSNSSDTRIDDHLELLKRQHVAATFKMVQNSYTHGVYGFSLSYGFLACTTNGTRPNPLRALATKVKYSDRTRIMITSTIDAALWSLTKPQHSKSWEVYQHDGGIVTYNHVQVYGVLVIQLGTHTHTRAHIHIRRYGCGCVHAHVYALGGGMRVPLRLKFQPS